MALKPEKQKVDTILCGDVLAQLGQLADGSVNCIVTSPPYWGLRDYGANGQIGDEDTPEEYIAKMVDVFRELWRVLRDNGTVWLNLGDTYAANRGYQVIDNKHIDVGNNQGMRVPKGLKPKDLVGIPWRVALALQADGWYLRSDIVWHKPNCLPESVKDRPTKAHEYVFLLTKSARYWYDADAIREPNSDPTRTNFTHGNKMEGARNDRGGDDFGGGTNGRNKRTVWTISTKPFKAAHFATFPEELAATCIKAGCPAQVCVECGEPWVRVVERGGSDWGERKKNGAIGGTKTKGANTTHGKGTNHTLGRRKTKTLHFAPTCQCCPLPAYNKATRPGIVLDPFFGAGTVGVVAKKLQRGWLGIELNPEYAAMALERIGRVQPPLPIVALAAEAAEDNGAEQLKLLAIDFNKK